MSRTRRTLGSYQIRVFCRRSEQLVGQEARRELEEALVHVLGAEASPEAALTIDKHRPSRLTVIGLRCRSPSIKVSINTFPSLLWSHRSKTHRKLTTVAQENSNSSEPPRSAAARRHEREPTSPPAGAVDPIANDRHLMKSVGPWAGAGGPGPQCCGHILRIFLKQNNYINPKNRWNLGILQKHPWTFS
jgi:hypothetical protein